MWPGISRASKVADFSSQLDGVHQKPCLAAELPSSGTPIFASLTWDERDLLEDAGERERESERGREKGSPKQTHTTRMSFEPPLSSPARGHDPGVQLW